MKRIAVVTDSTTLDSPKLLNHPDLYVAPLEVIANGKTYEDRVECTSCTITHQVEIVFF